MEDVNGNYGYSTGGYTISGLKNLQNKTHELYVERRSNHEIPSCGTEQPERVPRKAATHSKYTQEMKDEIVRLKKEEKMPRNLIAEKFGITVKAVEHILYDKPISVFGTGTQLDESQLKWFIKHFKHTKNDDIVAKLNISRTSLHRLARQHNLTKSKDFMRKTQLAAAARAKESHEINGTYPPKGYVIPKAEEVRFKKGEGLWKRISKRRSKEIHAKAIESLNKTRAKEKRRVLYGFEQETNLRVVAAPRPKTALKCNMRKRYGYIVQRCKDVIYYDNNTKRKPEIEKKAIGFGFEIRAYETKTDR